MRNKIHATKAALVATILIALGQKVLADDGPTHDYELLKVFRGEATYLLTDTISHVVPQTATIWTLSVYTNPRTLGPWTFDYEIDQDEFDCVRQTYQPSLYASFYRIGFRLVQAHQFSDAELVPPTTVTPGSVGWDEYERACGGISKDHPPVLDRSKPTDREAVEIREWLKRGLLRPDN